MTLVSKLSRLSDCSRETASPLISTIIMTWSGQPILQNVLILLRRRQKARQVIEQRFSWHRVCDDMDRTYQAMCTVKQ